MNSNYLMSILDLYLSKEKNHQVYLTISKYTNEKVKFDFKMNDLESLDTTSFFLDYDIVMQEDVLKEMLDKFKQNLIVIDEDYEYDKIHGTCFYKAVLTNGRIICFKNFTLAEINNIRNILYNANFNISEISINNDIEDKEGFYKNYRLSEAGFAGYLTMVFFALIVLSAPFVMIIY